MEFCEVVLRQLDGRTAEVRVAVNTEVMLAMRRKKRTTAIVEWYDRLSTELLKGLEREFGEGPEGLGDVSIRTHVGVSTGGIPFVSALAIAEVREHGGGLTISLRDNILQNLKGAMQERSPLVDVTMMELTPNTVSYRVDFDIALLHGDKERMIESAQAGIRQEISKGNWNIRL